VAITNLLFQSKLAEKFHGTELDSTCARMNRGLRMTFDEQRGNAVLCKKQGSAQTKRTPSSNKDWPRIRRQT
jgi:hypothetical protein